MALYPKIESIGSIGSIILAILEVQVPFGLHQRCWSCCGDEAVSPGHQGSGLAFRLGVPPTLAAFNALPRCRRRPAADTDC